MQSRHNRCRANQAARVFLRQSSKISRSGKRVGQPSDDGFSPAQKQRDDAGTGP